MKLIICKACNTTYDLIEHQSCPACGFGNPDQVMLLIGMPQLIVKTDRDASELGIGPSGLIELTQGEEVRLIMDRTAGDGRAAFGPMDFEARHDDILKAYSKRTKMDRFAELISPELCWSGRGVRQHDDPMDAIADAYTRAGRQKATDRDSEFSRLYKMIDRNSREQSMMTQSLEFQIEGVRGNLEDMKKVLHFLGIIAGALIGVLLKGLF